MWRETQDRGDYVVDWLYGVWTYRSFYDRETPAATIDDIVLAEGEMAFEAAEPGKIRGQLAFRSNPPDPQDPILTFAGSSETGSPAAARFRGTGVAGTAAEGWIYDYTGYLVPNWPGGKDQKTVLVGTVTRLVDHKGGGGSVRHAGDVYSFVAVRREFPEPKTVIPIPEPALSILASRHHRLHHLVWHTLRNSWTDDEAIPPPIKQEIRKLGWEPLRPVLSPVGDPLFGNGSGEDFLYMHRQMVLEVNDLLTEIGKPPIQPWATIPPPGPIITIPDYGNPKEDFMPGNPDGFSVPPAWFPPDNPLLDQRLVALKTPEFYWGRMRWWDRQYKDPAYLSTLTLGELGTLLEWTVHNDMHMRWASMPRDPRTNAAIPQGRADGGNIDKVWDDPSYDHLGEQYSSHVNPVFWRLHGWVDARIEDWFAAHEAAHPGEVRRAKVMGTPWFAPGKWVQVDMPWPGPMHHMHGIAEGAHGHGDDPDEDVKIMERIIALIFSPQGATPAALALKTAPAAVHARLRSHF
jgi:hypothetical protein